MSWRLKHGTTDLRWTACPLAKAGAGDLKQRPQETRETALRRAARVLGTREVAEV